MTRVLLICLLVLVSLGASPACRRPDDCTLLGTCPGSLLKRAETLAGKDRAAACRQCILEQCGAETLACEPIFACNFSARCRLSASPSEYQACLQGLYETGLTVGDERRFPWEGQDPNPFSNCFHAKCRSACINDPFVCDETEHEYDDPHLKVAVRLYQYDRPVTQVSVKLCEDRGKRAQLKLPNCMADEQTDDAGIASFAVKGHIAAEGMYFEIAGQDGAYGYPRTLYYPGRLGDKEPSRGQDPQLIAIYVLSNQLIASGNRALEREEAVLQDAGQSLILTDSCVWERVAAPGLRVKVEGVAQCHGLPKLCDDTGCPPCVWYAVGEFPDREAGVTDGTGAGVVGLSAGFYTIRVEREDGSEVSERERVRMENGTMTIVRTWPPENERGAQARDAGT